MTGLTRQFALVLSAGLMLYTNLGGRSGLTTTDSDDMYVAYPTAFTPAPYTFAIWGLIFTGVIALVVYQALPAQRSDGRLDRLGWAGR